MGTGNDKQQTGGPAGPSVVVERLPSGYWWATWAEARDRRAGVPLAAIAPTEERARWKLLNPLEPYEPLPRAEAINAIARDAEHERDLLRRWAAVDERSEELVARIRASTPAPAGPVESARGPSVEEIGRHLEQSRRDRERLRREAAAVVASYGACECCDSRRDVGPARTVSHFDVLCARCWWLHR